MKCPKCDNEDLQFVNATIQTGKDFLLLKIVLFITGTCAMIAFFVSVGYLSHLTDKSDDRWLAFFSYPAGKVFVYFFTAFVTDLILIKLIPYKTKNEIRAVCPHCGHVEELSSLIQSKIQITKIMKNRKRKKTIYLNDPQNSAFSYF